MPELLTQCGSERCNLEQLLAIPEPEQTETYTPLNHYDFAVNVKTLASNMLRDFTFAKEAYALSASGNKMFGVLSYASKSTSDDDPLRLSIGIRNSLDKSLAAGVAVGTSVIVCDNLMFKGDVTVLRKHSGNMHEELMDQVVTAIYKSQHQYSQLCFDAARMMEITLDKRSSYEYLGILTGEGILSPTQSTKAFKELDNPSHPEFEKSSLWSTYNACTEALKSTPPQSMVRNHSRLHALTEDLYLN
ncbi:DUF932 domain-containing protein [Rhodohalobacter sp. SW132]|uniref:DUF932 domain-containing protein n=1 Tax=Rhodohalobacter sp. SW132 TaxID=2293433 RepID=UPI000E246AF2|nr:DUF932 domain-containing protein [Rhodohalobacter sp. SW132]REL37877.1 DUF932 domain-containing protein [Rhodohalobacter sp. SW132]